MPYSNPLPSFLRGSHYPKFCIFYSFVCPYSVIILLCTVIFSIITLVFVNTFLFACFSPHKKRVIKMHLFFKILFFL